MFKCSSTIFEQLYIVKQHSFMNLGTRHTGFSATMAPAGCVPSALGATFGPVEGREVGSERRTRNSPGVVNYHGLW